jgi:hypothetical protein
MAPRRAPVPALRLSAVPVEDLGPLRTASSSTKRFEPPKFLVVLSGIIGFMLLAAALVQAAGSVSAPTSVTADANGAWDAFIIVTNPTNPNFSLTGTNNTSASYTITMGTGQWTYMVSGNLIDRTRNGSITFQVDPPEQIVIQTITIRSSVQTTGMPALGPWTLLLIALALGSIGAVSVRAKHA